MQKTLSKTIFIVFFLITSVSFINKSKTSETYKVIKVIGEIVVKKTGESLSFGDMVGAKETVVFRTKGAKASVVNDKGRFTLTAKGLNGSESSIKNNLLPAMSNISARSGPILNLVDLQNYCSGTRVILDEIKLYIDSKAFTMNDSNFFFVRYNYNKEQIDKKLSYIHDTLILNQQQIFIIDNIRVKSPELIEIGLYYFSKKEANAIANFTLAFPEKDQLIKELDVLVYNGVGSGIDKQNEILSYLNEFYGKPDASNVSQWVKTNLRLKHE